MLELLTPEKEVEFGFWGRILVGKTAFVTGALRGIGKAIALALAGAGAEVAVSCNTGGTLAESVRDTIRDMGQKSEFYAHKIADPVEVDKLHAEIVRDFGHVDLLVNNSGITRETDGAAPLALKADAMARHLTAARRPARLIASC
jgi:NAD(P)-dependent dehydrogenase (short-subunit alcohol dehydrogenase family)